MRTEKSSKSIRGPVHCVAIDKGNKNTVLFGSPKHLPDLYLLLLGLIYLLGLVALRFWKRVYDSKKIRAVYLG